MNSGGADITHSPDSMVIVTTGSPIILTSLPVGVGVPEFVPTF